ncbi:metallophosphoesterase family protein [uncultured Proteiniphilum sp.]|uniref:purple acid phosphatase family protein n=1 Tax=uncultured Proteiniphilum sp. TaxID=497637 RepID=UPI002621231B|nr:metallophosphoesterase family protein [uncultured Proteiniphilum sp.]
MKTRCFLFFVYLPFFLFSQGIKITNGPYIQRMGENEATIIWTTNNDAISWIELAPAGNDSFYAAERPQFYDTSHGNRVIGKLHHVTVKGLSPGTGYRYRIFSKEVLGYEGHRLLFGNIASSEVYRNKPLTFTTLDRDKKAFSFRVVNDIHGKADNLRAMLKDVKKENTDLVFFNGDMISTLNDEKEIFTGFMDTAVELFASEVPVFYTRGNHETRGKASSGLYDYFPGSNGNFYYAFRHGSVFFLVLDSGEDKPDSDIEYSELAQFDNYRDQQKEWIETVVTSPEFQSAPFRIVIMHIPPAGSTWHGTQDVAQKFLPLLNKANINVMLCGHTHNYKYIDRGEEQNIHFPVLINDDETYLDITVNSRIDIRQKDMSGKTLHTHIIDSKN